MGSASRRRSARLGSLPVLALQHLHLLLEIRLQRLQIEARTLLHRGVLEEGLGILADGLLHVGEAPELVGEPTVEVERSGETRALEGIETQIDDDRPVDLHGAAEPAARLVDEAILVVVDANGAERRLREV